MVSTHLKNISQIVSFPQVGVKIKNVWNHHLVKLGFLGKLLYLLATKPAWSGHFGRQKPWAKKTTNLGWLPPAGPMVAMKLSHCVFSCRGCPVIEWQLVSLSWGDEEQIDAFNTALIDIYRRKVNWRLHVWFKFWKPPHDIVRSLIVCLRAIMATLTTTSFLVLKCLNKLRSTRQVLPCF